MVPIASLTGRAPPVHFDTLESRKINSLVKALLPWFKKSWETMKKNTKLMLLTGAVVLVVIAVLTGIIIAVSPFFQIANVVSGGH
jgi:hypothetical protein